ncbi:MAG: glycosyltransferase family 4 protein [Pseudomonadota bacterium]
MPLFDSDLASMSSAASELAKLADRLTPDIIHADNFRGILFASQLNSRNRYRVVSHIRDNRFFCSQRDQPTNIGGVVCKTCELGCLEFLKSKQVESTKFFMERDRQRRRQILANSASVVVTSSYLKKQINSLDIGKPILIVPNPPDIMEHIDNFQVDIYQANPPEILVVGMLNANKGQHRVVEWITRLRESIVDFRIVLAGRGRMMEKLRREASKAGHSDYLVTPGFLGRAELYRCYARSSVVLVPNTWPEPFGRVPLEAGLSRRPVVAYALGGIRESVVDGKTGVLVEALDEDALLRSTVDLVLNRQRALQMGECARRHIVDNYSLQKTADSLSAIWQAKHQTAKIETKQTKLLHARSRSDGVSLGSATN